MPSTQISSEPYNDINPLQNDVVLENPILVNDNIDVNYILHSLDISIDNINNFTKTGKRNNYVDDNCNDLGDLEIDDVIIDVMKYDNTNDNKIILGDNSSETHENINNVTDNICVTSYDDIESVHNCETTKYSKTFCDSYGQSNHTDESVSILVRDKDHEKKMEILVWNIQGLGDKLKDIDFFRYISKYDLIIFLETMKLDKYSPNTGEFVYKHYQRTYQHPRARKPAGGIGVLIKSSLDTSGTVKIIRKSDFSVWIKIKQSDEIDSFLGAVYIPPLDSSSTVPSFINNNAFSMIQEEISYFSHKGNVAICGDFNARTGQLADYTDIPGNDVFDFIQFGSMDTFPMYDRYSDDHKSNKYGKDLLELCKSSNMRIMNGYFQNDKNTGAYTCYTARGKSLIDYLICDLSFYQSLLHFDLEPLCTNSDHRPLIFTIRLYDSNTNLPQNPSHNHTSARYYKYLYDPNKLAS